MQQNSYNLTGRQVRLTVLIVIMSILLLINIFLIAMLCAKNSKSDKSIGNVISSTGSTESFYFDSDNPQVNKRFEFENMLPGDSATNLYSITLYHDQDVNLSFQVKEGLDAELAEVLQITVTNADTDHVVYDGYASQLGDEASVLVKANGKTKSMVNLQITLTLSEEAGNNIQGKTFDPVFSFIVDDKTALCDSFENNNWTILNCLVIASLIVILLLIAALIARARVTKYPHSAEADSNSNQSSILGVFAAIGGTLAGALVAVSALWNKKDK